MKTQLIKLSSGFMVLLFLALMVPIATSAAAASGSTAKPSLVADGTMMMSAATSTVEATTSLIDSTTTLGAPATSATVLGDGACSANALFTLGCDIGNTFVDSVATVASCSLVGLIIFSVQGCLTAAGKVLGDLVTLALWPLTSSLQAMAITIGAGIRDLALSLSNWVLNTELNGSFAGVANPVLSCKNATGAVQAAQCSNPNTDSWFQGQFNVMRQIALFLLVPFFMLVVIQSILRGSMYLLVRSAFVMLPVAIIGSVVVVYFLQLMLNLSDQFVGMISNYTGNIASYDQNLATQMQTLDMSNVNWLSVIWLILVALGAGVIYLELLVRQVGVYMSALFLPLAFAALVWPTAAGFLRRLVELVLGLIFSKVFIAAAISLGITALGNTDVAGLTSVPGQTNTAATSALSSVITGSLIFMMAAFAGTKVIAMTPAAMSAAEGRVFNPGSAWGGFQLADPAMGRAAEASGNINRFIKSHNGKGFSNEGQAGNSPTPQGGGKPRPDAGNTPKPPKAIK